MYSGKEGVVCLTVRERILIIRLLEKQKQHPQYAKALGIQISGAKNA